MARSGLEAAIHANIKKRHVGAMLSSIQTSNDSVRSGEPASRNGLAIPPTAADSSHFWIGSRPNSRRNPSALHPNYYSHRALRAIAAINRPAGAARSGGNRNGDPHLGGSRL